MIAEDKIWVNVSIVAANHNQGKFIPDLINSIQNSSYLPVECIIVDDASSDDSIKYLAEYKNLEFLKIIYLREQIGFANALNTGIRHSKGKYIMRVDPDDYIHAQRIEKQFKFLEQQTNVDLVGSNVTYVDEEGMPIYESSVPLKVENIEKTVLNGGIPLFNGTLLGRRELFEQFPYNQEKVKAEDYDLFSRCIKAGRSIRNMPENLTFYRMHRKSASHSDLFDTFKKILQIREEVFNIPISKFDLWQNYLHIKFYKSFLDSRHRIVAYVWLIPSLLLSPSKLISRLKIRTL